MLPIAFNEQQGYNLEKPFLLHLQESKNIIFWACIHIQITSGKKGE